MTEIHVYTSAYGLEPLIYIDGRRAPAGTSVDLVGTKPPGRTSLVVDGTVRHDATLTVDGNLRFTPEHNYSEVP